MTKEELKKLDEELAQEELNLINQLEMVANKNPLVQGDYEAKLPNYGDEEDENVQEIVEFEKNLALTKELEDKLNSIRKTRQKIKEGTYGKCENCGQDILYERLKAMPEATKCVTCAAISD
jgi:RNA polymerase-binding transcription factor DksA